MLLIIINVFYSLFCAVSDSETIENKILHLPSYIEALASILSHLDEVSSSRNLLGTRLILLYIGYFFLAIPLTEINSSPYFCFQIPEMFMPVLENLIVYLIEQFPLVTPNLRFLSYHAIIKVLMAFYPRGTHFKPFIAKIGIQQNS